MRKLKFRAWSEDGRKKLGGKMLAHDDMCDDFGNIDIFQREGYSVMQYTGLKDKNGVEIYEGDVVQNWEGIMWGEVVWNKEWACFETTARFIEMNEEMEVIGNIYENPELLANN